MEVYMKSIKVLFLCAVLLVVFTGSLQADDTYSELLLQKAKSGDAVAQNELALCYNEGKGVVQDHKEAVKWYRLAAEQGYARAQFNLGLMYDKGEGVIQDFKEAVRCYRLAAEKGNAPAQYNLGYKIGRASCRERV